MFEVTQVTTTTNKTAHILYLETSVHLRMEDIGNTKSHLENLYHDHAPESYLHMLPSPSTAVSEPLDTSNFCFEVFVRCHLHYWQAQEDLPIDSSLCSSLDRPGSFEMVVAAVLFAYSSPSRRA